MTRREIDQFGMLVRVRGFGETYARAFPASTLGGELFGRVGTIVDELKWDGADQRSATNAAIGETKHKRAAARTLRATLAALSRTAAAIARGTHGGHAAFRVPHGNGHARLLNAARGILDRARPMADQFIAHALPDTFLEGLSADIERLEQARHDRDARRSDRIGARAALRAALATGLDAAYRLDAIVANRLRDDHAALVLWHSVRHIPRGPSSSPRLQPSSGEGAR